MSESRIFKAWGAGCWRQAILAVAAWLVIVAWFLGIVILSVSLPLTDSQKVYLWVGGLLFLFSLMTGGILLWSFNPFKQRATRLDAAFNPLGLNGKPYLWNGRQYHGSLNGRHMDVYFYRGPSLAIFIAAPLHTRLGIGMKGKLSQVASKIYNRKELVIDDPELANLSFFPLDEQWSRQLIEIPQARLAILDLLPPAQGFELRNLMFQPEAIQFQIRCNDLHDLTSENIRSWVNGMLSLAEIAESLPTPSVTAAASAMEHKTRTDRGGFTLPIIGITCAVIAFCSIMIIVVFVLLFSLVKVGM